MLQWQLDPFAQLVTRRVEPADILPAERRHLDHHFAHRRGRHPLQRIFEIIRIDRQRIEDFGRNRRVVEVDPRQDPPHRLQRRLAHQRRKIRADKAIGPPRKVIEVDPVGQRHPARVNPQNLAPSGLIRHPDDDLAVEPARPTQRFVDRFGPIGRSDYDEILARLDPVHQRQQLRD